MDLNEAQTRAERIDGQLADAGWSVTAFNFEEEYEVGRSGDPQHGFVDYLLPDARSAPLAIVEAKRSSRDVLAGMEQARQYADAIEGDTGVRPFVFLANGNQIYFSDGAANPRPVSGFFSLDDLERLRYQQANRLPLSQPTVDRTIAGRPYQLEAIRRAQARFEEGHRRALWVMATGSGKTRTTTALIKTLIEASWVQKVLFLVDRDALATQALAAFNDHLPHEPSSRLKSGSYDPGGRLYVATLQTMQDFHEEFSPAAFDLIVSDECHRSIFNKWNRIFQHFDARVLGLTATPADFVDRNTFIFFGCDDRTPTFAYEYEQAVEDGFLVPYEVWHARTQFQVEGISGEGLTDDQRRELEEGGIDPDDIDFAGTDLERRVTNEDTTRKLVKEFIDNSIKEPNGNLPGKSIVYAISHAHARRLYEMFNELYPQWPGLAEIIDSHMEQPGETLARFKRESMPRVAISVDMLDTGVDIPPVVNLALMKPIYSKIKFWQIVGRGTRTIDATNAKPWCPVGSKARFRILDFWANFEYFSLNPEGEVTAASTPVPVRYFRILTRVLAAAQGVSPALASSVKADLRRMIGQLPVESAGVRDDRELVERVSEDAWWVTVDDRKLRTLAHNVAPLMRFLGGVDLAALSFSGRCLEFVLLKMTGEGDAEKIATQIQEDLIRLPLEHSRVSPRRDVIRASYERDWIPQLDVEQVLELRKQLAELMRYRQSEPSAIVILDLEDAFKEQRWVTVGPEAREFKIDEYRAKVEHQVRELAAQHPAFLKMATNQPLSDQDVAAIEAELHKPELYINETSLKKAYQAPHGSLVALLRHALGIEELPSRDEAVRAAVSAFIDQVEAKGNLTSDQTLFLRLFEKRLLMVGRVERHHLYEPPFTMAGIAPSDALSDEDLDALLSLAAEYSMPYDT